MTAALVRCLCREWAGESACDWEGDRAETTLVSVVPSHLRDRAAAQLSAEGLRVALRVHVSCALLILSLDTWARPADGASWGDVAEEVAAVRFVRLVGLRDAAEGLDVWALDDSPRWHRRGMGARGHRGADSERDARAAIERVERVLGLERARAIYAAARGRS